MPFVVSSGVVSGRYLAQYDEDFDRALVVTGRVSRTQFTCVAATSGDVLDLVVF